ncbi:hypothetical protein [Desulfofustis phage LS06-2018-MD01]|nr:hypothetical protein [Desulfofustis phage LS06-2018-MD01]
MRNRDIDDLHRSEVPSDPTQLNGKPKWAVMIPASKIYQWLKQKRRTKK